MITFDDIKRNSDIRILIEKADKLLETIGYTEHSFAHVGKVADTTEYILSTLGYSAREVEIAKIAAYLHDIGNIVNRVNHSETGAIMAYQILDKMGMDIEEIATIVTAIGNHDEGTAEPINAITAALIIADKTDVRRSRVRHIDFKDFDIHDRVNYATKKTIVKINEEKTLIKLKISIETKYCAVMEYFEIFLNRMLLCKKAAQKLGLQFRLIINEQQVL